MKIYIETNMTELPKNCNDCPYLVTTNYKSWRTNRYEECTYCPFGNQCYKFEGHINIMGDYDEIDTCPLRTETEIADKVNENVPEKLYGVYGEDNEGMPCNKPYKVFSDVTKAKEYAISQKGKIAWGIAPVYEICSKKVYEKVKKIDVIE